MGVRSFGNLVLRGQGSGQSRGRDGEADDPDFRQGEAHCPEAATRGTGWSSEGVGAAGPPGLGEGVARGAWAPLRGLGVGHLKPPGIQHTLSEEPRQPRRHQRTAGSTRTDARALPPSTALWVQTYPAPGHICSCRGRHACAPLSVHAHRLCLNYVPQLHACVPFSGETVTHFCTHVHFNLRFAHWAKRASKRCMSVCLRCYR